MADDSFLYDVAPLVDLDLSTLLRSDNLCIVWGQCVALLHRELDIDSVLVAVVQDGQLCLGNGPLVLDFLCHSAAEGHPCTHVSLCLTQ